MNEYDVESHHGKTPQVYLPTAHCMHRTFFLNELCSLWGNALCQQRASSTPWNIPAMSWYLCQQWICEGHVFTCQRRKQSESEHLSNSSRVWLETVNCSIAKVFDCHIKRKDWMCSIYRNYLYDFSINVTWGVGWQLDHLFIVFQPSNTPTQSLTAKSRDPELLQKCWSRTNFFLDRGVSFRSLQSRCSLMANGNLFWPNFQYHETGGNHYPFHHLYGFSLPKSTNLTTSSGPPQKNWWKVPRS